MIQDITYEGQTVSVNFNSEYKNMKNTREILARAGIVKAFTQIQGVSDVEFFCEGEPMTDAAGVLIGKMDKNTFVENKGENINSYVHTSLNLYFADENGDSLKKENISVYYSSNVPLEREVVERLLKGPKTEGLKPTLSPNTNILGVSIVEGICYVNLDKSFLSNSNLLLFRISFIYMIPIIARPKPNTKSRIGNLNATMTAPPGILKPSDAV